MGILWDTWKKLSASSARLFSPLVLSPWLPHHHHHPDGMKLSQSNGRDSSRPSREASIPLLLRPFAMLIIRVCHLSMHVKSVPDQNKTSSKHGHQKGQSNVLQLLVHLLEIHLCHRQGWNNVLSMALLQRFHVYQLPSTTIHLSLVS